MVGRFDNIHPGLSCDQARNILGLPIGLLESQSDLYMAAAHLINCPGVETEKVLIDLLESCLLYTSPSPRDRQKSRMPSSA